MIITTTKVLVLTITLATGPQIEAALPADTCISAAEAFDLGMPIFTEDGELLDVEEVECLPPHPCAADELVNPDQRDSCA